MTYSPSALEAIYDHVEDEFPSMKRGGIYARKSGYHSSYNDNVRYWPGNYSTVAPADKRGDRNAARAIDLTFGSTSEITTATRRLIEACKRGDDRIEWLREVIGTLDHGQSDVTYNRYASGSGSRSRTGLLGDWASDDSHEWHIHLSFFTDYATDKDKALQVCEVICGLKAGDAKGSGRPKPKGKKVPTGNKRLRVKILAGPKEGGWFFGTRYLNVDHINLTRAKANSGHWRFDRELHQLQEWLVEVGYGQSDKVEATGYWNGKTQRAYNDFRRSVGYRGDDAVGSVGAESLRKLQRAAADATVKHIK